MNNALKGALLSGLVIPGLGQIVFKHYLRGTLMIVAVLTGLTAIVIKTVELALAILATIQTDGGAVSLGTISKAASLASINLFNSNFTLLFLALIACWIIGVVDAYLLGRKKDIEDGKVIGR